jgi:acyl-CoA oxidase
VNTLATDRRRRHGRAQPPRCGHRGPPRGAQPNRCAPPPPRAKPYATPALPPATAHPRLLDASDAAPGAADTAPLAAAPARAAAPAPPPAGAPGTSPAFPHAQTIAAFPPAAHDALGLGALLSPAERGVQARVRAFAEQEIAPVIAGFWERAEFPHALVPGFAALGVGGGSVAGHGCPGMSMMACAAATVELARVDGSFSTFYLVHAFLAVLTIGLLGSEAQKAELLPDLAALRTVGCWALTEPSNGSDAAALTTVARRAPGGWRLTGRKRWIGNATFADVLVVWARNAESGQVNAFIVRKGNPGCRVTKIENKIALRCVQNGDIELAEAFVPDADRLPGVESFADTNRVLAVSRVMVAWQPVGLALGAYDATARYVGQRRQFGAPLAAFQLVQEKLQRMLATAQAMWLMAWRLTRLAEEGEMTHEQASLVKAWTTARGREVRGRFMGSWGWFVPACCCYQLMYCLFI